MQLTDLNCSSGVHHFATFKPPPGDIQAMATDPHKTFKILYKPLNDYKVVKAIKLRLCCI